MKIREYLIPIALWSLPISSLSIAVGFGFYASSLQSRAEEIAVRKFADKQAPLTESERQDWYKSMDISRPHNILELRRYINENSD